MDVSCLLPVIVVVNIIDYREVGQIRLLDFF